MSVITKTRGRESGERRTAKLGKKAVPVGVKMGPKRGRVLS